MPKKKDSLFTFIMFLVPTVILVILHMIIPATPSWVTGYYLPTFLIMALVVGAAALYALIGYLRCLLFNKNWHVKTHGTQLRESMVIASFEEECNNQKIHLFSKNSGKVFLVMLRFPMYRYRRVLPHEMDV